MMCNVVPLRGVAQLGRALRSGRRTSYKFHTPLYCGAWLSLVERGVRDAEVAGSNPVAPIISQEH